jgi:hypothetical protein
LHRHGSCIRHPVNSARRPQSGSSRSGLCAATIGARTLLSGSAPQPTLSNIRLRAVMHISRPGSPAPRPLISHLGLRGSDTRILSSNSASVMNSGGWLAPVFSKWQRCHSGSVSVCMYVAGRSSQSSPPKKKSRVETSYASI